MTTDVTAEEAMEYGTTAQWVTLRIDDDMYGIDVSKVQEVLNIPEITPVPGAPEYVIGIVNLRGNVVTVLDARKRFGLAPRQHDERSQIVILRIAEQALGILVDSVSEVVELPVDHIELAPDAGSGSTKKHIHGIYSIDGKLLILINTDCLVE